MILLLLLVYNAFALFGAGMSQDGVYPYVWFVVGVAFLAWGIFYRIQFVRPKKNWRLPWFILMVIFLFFREIGLGTEVSLKIIG